jgi:hypothetical protein
MISTNEAQELTETSICVPTGRPLAGEVLDQQPNDGYLTHSSIALNHTYSPHDRA